MKKRRSADCFLRVGSDGWRCIRDELHRFHLGDRSLFCQVKLILEDPSSPLASDECPLLMSSGTSPCTGIAEYIFNGCELSGLHLRRALEICKRPWSLTLPRGDGNGCRFVRSLCHLTQYIRSCPLFPVQWRSIELPAPMESGGDATPCKVTTEDLGIFFITSLHHVLLQGGFKKLVRKSRYAPAGASLCRGLRWFRGDFGGHRSKPCGWGNSAGELA